MNNSTFNCLTDDSDAFCPCQLYSSFYFYNMVSTFSVLLRDDKVQWISFAVAYYNDFN